eukprot:CAMPEP_0204623828 /NCGR_PEP_ID=MMETSP0717-20131115/9592_1 /ASSEMBLY_ACC=CAM_ASM_000666 /TAXON_ID=230516 /ORGANISM="Chaetoceros curvisetus" /LENGTH=365 /DNA_ID=CAMNT_0051639033 /DNA_START=6 /DNA_END=1103 /DNA_ORIENTATION=-
MATSSSSAPANDEKYTYSMDDRFTLPSVASGRTKTKKATINDGLCLDQKGFFAHLSPRALVLSTIRTSILQASTILTSYFTEQLAHETSLEEKMVAGEITPMQLDVLNSKWEEEEWDKKWQLFPEKLKKGLVKYHVLILVMRAYEGLFGLVLSRETMDKLTKDPFKYARQKSPVTTSTSSTSGDKDTEKSYTSDMFQTCFYSNIVSFLADYTIQQTILCYGFYTFIKTNKREKRLQMLKDLDLKQEQQKQEDAMGLGEEGQFLHSSLQDDLVKAHDSASDRSMDGDDDGDNEDEKKIISDNDGSSSNGGLLLSFTYKSSKLLVARSIGLFVAGVGGAVGSILRPGWGTLFGIQIGDACVGALLDE